MTLARLYFCPEHIYTGHFGKPAGTASMARTDRVQVVAGRGIVGDRYFQRPPGGKGQVTFFSEEVWVRLQTALDKPEIEPDVFRRNVITRGVDLNSLIGAEFEIQGVRFRGTEHCKPCFWMNQAFGEGALEALLGWQGGGLRAQALTDGWLASD